jgi:hypothetical protein
MDLDLITIITIEKPPKKYEKWVNKKVIVNRKWTGERKMKKVVYYLTANLFFDRNVWVVHEIKSAVKRHIKPYFDNIPKLEKMQLDIIFSRQTQTYDLDNMYFWEKVILDLLKTPTSKQLLNAYKRGNDIITCEVLKDDTVQYVDKINKSFVLGKNEIIIKIYGRKLNEQVKLI